MKIGRRFSEMKQLFLFSCLLLTVLSCGEKDPARSPDELVEWTFIAPATKASIDGKGAFSWKTGDEIAIWNSTAGGFVTFSTATGSGIFSAQAPANSEFTGTSFFPASSATDAHSVELPASYSVQQLSEGAGIHMSAPVLNDSNCLEFKHLTAYLTVQLTDTPATIDRVVIGSDGHSLSGEFEVDGSSALSISGGSATTTVTFPAQEGQTVSFTVPVPVGEYQVSITAGDGNTPSMISMHTGTVSFLRAHQYKLAPASPQTSFSTRCEVYEITQDDGNWE